MQNDGATLVEITPATVAWIEMLGTPFATFAL
jgi:hypothetical protein